jgi:hypothetical protein
MSESEVEASSTFWNMLSQKGQLGLSTSHKILVQSDFLTVKGTPKCVVCGVPMVEAEDSTTKTTSKYLWKLNCKCAERNPKLKDMRLSFG